MFDRLARSWHLVKASAAVLRSDKELLLFPVISSVAMLLVVATFLVPVLGLRLFEQGGVGPLGYAIGFLFYLVQYFVIFFFNSALVGAAMIRLQGGDPTVADGLRIAWSKVGVILGYAAIAATVGMLLKAIEERVGFLGKLVTGLLGTAWTLATFLAVPVLVSREIGPIDAVKESAALLKKTWGENLIGQGGVGVVFGLIYVAMVLLGIAVIVLAAMTGNGVLIGTAVAVMVVAFVLVALIHAALAGIYSAALYRYAMGEASSTGFDGQMLQQAFRLK